MTILTAEMIVDANNADDVQISPDGATVAFVVAPIGQKDEHPASAIWIARAAEAASASKLTAGMARDCSPRWSPDGDALYFLSDRQKRGIFQLYRIALNGGEAEALTDWEPGIDSPLPLPGGASVAFLAVDPDDEAAKKRKEDRDDAEVYGERWPWQNLRVLDLASREIATIDALGERHVVQATPSPDGSRIAVIAWPTPELDNGTWNGEILVVDLATRAATPICDLRSGGSCLSWGPDSSELFFLAHISPASRGGEAVFAVDVTGGTPRQVTADLAACPGGLATARDGTPYVLMAEGLDSWIGRLDVERTCLERVQALLGGAWSLDVSDDGQTLAVARSTRDNLAGVWAGPAGQAMHALTNLNPALAKFTWGTQELITWSAPDGLQIEGLLILPPGAAHDDGPFPLMTLVHGGPYLRYADSLQLSAEEWGQWLATAGYAVLLPNPRGSRGRGHDFADRVAGAVGAEDWADIEAGIDHLVAEGIADAERLGIGGWSYGGLMTAWAVGHTCRKFKLGIMGAGISDFGMLAATSDLPNYARMTVGSAGWEGIGPHPHDAFSSISFASQVQTPVLILHGAEDARVPVSQGRFFAQALREHGVPNELVVYPREPHGIGERAHQLDLLGRVRDWVERWLGPGWQKARDDNESVTQ